ncbi:MAG: hypothetical protein Q9167_006979 [Letrouitia subvulpina]
MLGADGKMTWDAEADRQLFLTVLKNQEIKVDAAGASKELGCTPLAVTKRIAKLKSMIRTKAEEDGKDGDASITNAVTENNGNAAKTSPPAKLGKVSKVKNPVSRSKTAPAMKKQKTANGTGKARGRPPKSAKIIATPDSSDRSTEITTEPKINFGGTHFEPINKPTNKRKRLDIDEGEKAVNGDFDRKVKDEEEDLKDGLENAENASEEA